MLARRAIACPTIAQTPTPHGDLRYRYGGSPEIGVDGREPQHRAVIRLGFSPKPDLPTEQEGYRMEFYNNHYLSDGYSIARKGMSMVRPFEIQKGHILYRFYDSNKARTPAEGANGAWWLEYEHFQAIKHFALRNGHSISYAARLFAAILYEWSEVNAWVGCEVTQPLHAWKGRGKQVSASGKDARDLPTMTPMQSILEIYQVVLPGVGGQSSIASHVLRVAKHERFSQPLGRC